MEEIGTRVAAQITEWADRIRMIGDHLLERGVASLGLLIDLGGPVVVVLLILSVVTLALILYKLTQFAVRGIGHRRVPERALRAWLAGRREDGYDLAARSGSPIAVAVAHAMRGVTKAGATDVIVREDVERVMMAQLSPLRSMIRPLEMIGQIAPLIGLLGTVIGMIEAFRQMQEAGSSVDPSSLAGGIWVALLTTAVGLAIAIPTTFIATWLDERVDREQAAMERFVTAVFTEQVTDVSREPERPLPASSGAISAHAA